MGVIIAFFTQLGQKYQQEGGPKNTRQAHVINIANLNYCGIMKSPFEFYSGKYQKELEQLSKIFDKLRAQYIPWQHGQTFAWKFSKLDKKIKDRYCPFYNIDCGIELRKFVTPKRFAELWHDQYARQEKATGSKFSEQEIKQALAFDMLAFHALLFRVFKILDLNDAVNCNPEVYLKQYRPFFSQSFLNEGKKLDQFKKGMGQSMADVVFVQEPDELLIQDVQKFNDKYFVSLSPDKDTLIFAKKSRFDKQYKTQEMLCRLTVEEQELLNWSKHTSFMFLDNYFLISGHLNSKKAENEADVKKLMTIMPIIKQKYKELDFICGMDANSYIPSFDKEIYMFPDSADIFTTVKKRTSMQVQTSKAEKLVQENKDAIMTTLPLKMAHVMKIDGEKPHQKVYLPLDEHPFDHFLIFAVIEEKRPTEKKHSAGKK